MLTSVFRAAILFFLRWLATQPGDVEVKHDASDDSDDAICLDDFDRRHVVARQMEPWRSVTLEVGLNPRSTVVETELAPSTKAQENASTEQGKVGYRRDEPIRRIHNILEELYRQIDGASGGSTQMHNEYDIWYHGRPQEGFQMG